MRKKFKLRAEQIVSLVEGRGGCIATDMITVKGHPVRFMYREQPERPEDSGWRFMAGTESKAYMDDPRNHEAYDINTIANYDRTIIAFLDAPVGSAYEKPHLKGDFTAVDDWKPAE